MIPSHHAGWSEQEICARAAAELCFGQAAYLGAGLPQRICDYVSANREVTFYFGDRSLGCTEEITEATFLPHAVPVNGGRLDVVFLAASVHAAHSAKGLIPVARFRPPEIADRGGVSRAVVLIPDLAQATESGLLRRLSRYTLDTPARHSVRIICALGVFDTTIAGLSVIELAHGVRVREVRSLLKMSPQYSASRTTANIVSYVQR